MTISAEEFDKAWREVQEYMKDKKFVMIVNEEVFCYKCQEHISRESIFAPYANSYIQCTCGQSYSLKRIKDYLNGEQDKGIVLLSV